VCAYFLLPETKALTLEELDTVFDVGNSAFATYYRRKLPWYMAKYVLRRDVQLMEPLFDMHEKDGHEDYVGESLGGTAAVDGQRARGM
jgi:hypothetical protein